MSRGAAIGGRAAALVAALLLAPGLAAAGEEAAESEWDDVVDDGSEWDDVVEEAPATSGGGTGSVAPSAPAQGGAASAGPAGAQGDFSPLAFIERNLRWEGYYENQVMVFTLPGYEDNPDGWGVDLMDYNKLRLDLKARPIRGFSVDADVVVQTFHGSKTYDLTDVLPRTFAGELALLEVLQPGATTYALEDEIYLDNAYITANFWRMRLKVGKQQIRFGAGWMWNPTDPFNDKDPLDPSYEKRGITAARLQLFLPHEGLVELYALPGDLTEDVHLEDSGLALRGRVGIGRWVLAGLYATFVEPQGLASFATFEPLEKRRHLAGLSVNGEIAGVGVWGELALNYAELGELGADAVLYGNPNCPFESDGTCWMEALAGANYTFEGGIMVQAEYLYNGRGYPHSSEYQLLDWFAYLEQRLRWLGEHYATAMVQVPIETIHSTFTLVAIANLSDGSVIINPWWEWRWTQYLSLNLYAAITWGDEETDEFLTAGRAGYARLRFSF